MRLPSEEFAPKIRLKLRVVEGATLLAILLLLLPACSSSHSTHLAYVTVSAGINAYRIDNHSGAPTSIFSSPFVVGASPAGIVVAPSNHFAYVANQLDDTISLLKIDQTSGALTEVLPRTSVGPGTHPGLLAMDSGGNFLFVADQGTNDVQVFSIKSTGALAAVSSAPVGALPSALALPTSGNLLFVSVPAFSVIYAFTVNSGVLNPVNSSPFSVPNGLSSVTVDPAGNFVYAPNPSTNTISGFAVQPSAPPFLQPISGSPFPVTCGSTASASCTPFGALVNPSGKFLYVANYASATLSQFGVDTSGVLSAISTTTAAPTAGTNSEFIVFDPVGTFYYVANIGSHSFSEMKVNSDGSLSPNSQTIQVGSVPRALAFTR